MNGRQNKKILVDVVFLPLDLHPQHLHERVVVVFDVLRATTSMVAALAAEMKEIRIFDSLDAAAAAAEAFDGPKLLCGESRCLTPPGFDLGNSPGAFAAAAHAGRVMFMCTTNGTRAIAAAREARAVLIGALVNVAAVAQRLARMDRDVTLLCAGTDGRIAMEDLIGAGAVLDALMDRADAEPASDAARIALRLFRGCRDNLRAVVMEAQGARNVLAVGLEEDVDFASRLNTINVVGVLENDRIRAAGADLPI